MLLATELGSRSSWRPRDRRDRCGVPDRHSPNPEREDREAERPAPLLVRHRPDDQTTLTVREVSPSTTGACPTPRVRQTGSRVLPIRVCRPQVRQRWPPALKSTPAWEWTSMTRPRTRSRKRSPRRSAVTSTTVRWLATGQYAPPPRSPNCLANCHRDPLAPRQPRGAMPTPRDPRGAIPSTQSPERLGSGPWLPLTGPCGLRRPRGAVIGSASARPRSCAVG